MAASAVAVVLALATAALASDGAWSSAPGAASPVVTITKLPMAAKWQDVPGDEKRFQGAGGERYRGMTKWFFHCRPRLKCDLVSARESGGNETQVTVSVRSVGMELSLDVDSACGKRKHTQEHEKGHVEICRRIYDQRAESAAKKACQAVIGKKFTGKGGDRQAAIGAAKKQAAQQICAQYRAATADVAEAVSRAYDEITKHARNQVSAEDGIKEAFGRVVVEPI
ncbi:MAG: hypothetical protein U0105_04855 [Candidatus Obscuribacterales bacterium]